MFYAIFAKLLLYYISIIHLLAHIKEYRIIIWSSRTTTIVLLNTFISTQNESMLAATAFCLWKAACFFCIWIRAHVGTGGCWPPIKLILSAFKTFKTKTTCNDNLFIIYSINGPELKYMNGLGICSIQRNTFCTKE